MTNLPDKQARFVEEYFVDLNATQAAIRAGYREKAAAEIGYEKLTKPHIAEAIAEAQEVRSERTEITQDMVLEGLHLAATREGDGSNHGARVAAWAHLGKHLGMFVERGEVNLKTTYYRTDEPMSEDEWMDAYGDKEAVGHA